MKYSVWKIVNGNNAVVSEGWTDIAKAKTSYHNTLTNLYNDIANVQTMAVMIVDNLGNTIEIDRYDKSMDAPAEEPAND